LLPSGKERKFWKMEILLLLDTALVRHRIGFGEVSGYPSFSMNIIYIYPQ
jgi:hypothetical protein